MIISNRLLSILSISILLCTVSNSVFCSLSAKQLIAAKPDVVTLKSSYSKLITNLSESNDQNILSKTVSIKINQSIDSINKVLVDFNSYCKVFPNIQSHKVIKTENNLVLTQRYLRPMFIFKQTKHNVIYNVNNCPNELTWVIPPNNSIQGASGKWTLTPINEKATKVTYTITAIPSITLPPGLSTIVLNFIQNDALKSLKKYCETAN